MVRMVSPAESDWGFRPFEVFGSSRSNCIDLPSSELLLPLGLVRIRPPVYHVKLMFWVREHRGRLLGGRGSCQARLDRALGLLSASPRSLSRNSNPLPSVSLWGGKGKWIPLP